VRCGKWVCAQPLIGVDREQKRVVSEMRVESEVGRDCRSLECDLSIEARFGRGHITGRNIHLELEMNLNHKAILLRNLKV